MQTSKTNTSFPAWKLKFREDCDLYGKRATFDVMGDFVMRLLWKNGVDPTVRAVVERAHEENPTGWMLH